jgi:hypothetical protein
MTMKGGLAALAFLLSREAGGLRGACDESVPEREARLPSQAPGRLDDPGIDDDRVPGEEFPHFGLCGVRALRALAQRLDVELLEDLVADSSAPRSPEVEPPRRGRAVLLRVGGVRGVEEDVRVNEDGALMALGPDAS